MENVFFTEMTDQFTAWLHGLKDRTAKGLIIKRIHRMELGNLGDIKALGDGLNEMRIDYGAGYRVYWSREGERFIILLAGGDKSSQSRDIKKAQMLMAELRKE